ncbi:hypothetical protein FGSG_10689 [Fusarium graminearum PH-1]|uniref:hypothetical protein n=1 Tax=Gibberella zeae (strain ATCC MYA-4620 / CBS 123657 / FGSC 9075 / NRRL 31084 / PH-1) TaxID=229533 RepID=UPI000023CE37|nr:hypothetical protein FGSG_10689 [Fusarium graminearum PH-1]ESU17437.1 hypothetical protein FGSG_10689 [Fusarium graminearum PH-1]|eukprot:XP_011319699.1 hypothetical protein FGSG_10689 [Fusarium graminearum PH-1]
MASNTLRNAKIEHIIYNTGTKCECAISLKAVFYQSCVGSAIFYVWELQTQYHFAVFRALVLSCRICHNWTSSYIPLCVTPIFPELVDVESPEDGGILVNVQMEQFLEFLVSSSAVKMGINRPFPRFKIIFEPSSKLTFLSFSETKMPLMSENNK